MKSGHFLLMAVAIALGAAGPVGATEPTRAEAAESRLSIKGFGTLGVARSDSDDAQFVRDLSQPYGLTTEWSGKVDSVIGLQASYQFDNEFEGVLQAMSRYRYDGSYRPEISWAFLRYDPTPALSLRAGRLGTEFYMLSDSRLVGYANLTVRPPPDYFGPLVFSYHDGFDAGATWQAGGGLLRGKFFAGVSPETTPFFADITWDLSGSLLVGGHLDYLAGPWQLRYSHARVRFNDEQPLDHLPGGDIALMAVPALSAADTWTRFDSLGAVYDDGPLQLQLMLSRTKHETDSYEDTKAGYAIAAYRLGAITPYLGYSRTWSKTVSLPPFLDPLLAAQILAVTAETHSNQHTWFLGARWDVREDLAVKAQVDLIKGSPTSLFPFRGDNNAWDGDMAVFSLTLDFVF